MTAQYLVAAYCVLCIYYEEGICVCIIITMCVAAGNKAIDTSAAIGVFNDIQYSTI